MLTRILVSYIKKLNKQLKGALNFGGLGVVAPLALPNIRACLFTNVFL
jgi:hypothetical protein